jgi:diaminopimelate decarboxylase
MEYQLAIRVGVSPENIIFNGPYKGEADLETALLNGSIVNLDSWYEVEIVKGITRKYPEHQMRVGIRCNFDIGGDRNSRFGFDVDGEAFKNTLESISVLPNCKVGGFHCHFSTRERNPRSYALRTQKMLDLSHHYFKDAIPDFINLGGGFFSKMRPELKKQFGYPIPSYQEYANAIAPQLRKHFPGSTSPQLILEPGTAITANIMNFVSKVIDIKRIRSQAFALVSGSIHNIKPTLNDKNLPILVFENERGAKTTNHTLDIVGYTCMEIDYLYRGYEGSLKAGDYVVFENVGAYTNVLKPPFISPSPPIIGYEADTRQYEIIKEHEKISDVFVNYVF